MNKNQINNYQFLICDTSGAGRSNLSVSVKLSKDGGTFTDATNSVTQVDTTNAPGLYQIQLTAEECNADVLTVQATLANGTNPAILESIQLGYTVDDIWNHTNDSISMTNLLKDLHEGIYNWQLTGTTLALYNSDDVQVKSFTVVKDEDDNIIKVSPLPVESE